MIISILAKSSNYKPFFLVGGINQVNSRKEHNEKYKSTDINEVQLNVHVYVLIKPLVKNLRAK